MERGRRGTKTRKTVAETQRDGAWHQRGKGARTTDRAAQTVFVAVVCPGLTPDLIPL